MSLMNYNYKGKVKNDCRLASPAQTVNNHSQITDNLSQ